MKYQIGKMRAAITAILAVAVLSACLFSVGVAQASTDPNLTVGTLNTELADSNETQLATENADGIQGAEIDLDWASLETGNGTWNSSMFSTYNTEISNAVAAGDYITIDLGIQNTPCWVFGGLHTTCTVTDLQSSAARAVEYEDQNGLYSDGTATDGNGPQADLVFNGTVRGYVNTYLAKLYSELPFSDFTAIRIGLGGSGEALYPWQDNPTEPSPNYSYWAYSASAEGGTGEPTGIGANPDPTWSPGETSPVSLTSAQIGTWINWYVDAVTNAEEWLERELDNAGYTGYFELMSPGDGDRPSAVSGYQSSPSGMANDGVLSVGADWQRYYQELASGGGNGTYHAQEIPYDSSTGVYDSSTGTNDVCTGTDMTSGYTPFSTTLNAWSSPRWITFLSDYYGYPGTGGEGPEWSMQGGTEETEYDSASSTGVMADGLKQAVGCNWVAYNWAHDNDLYMTGEVSESQFATEITTYNP